MRTFCAAVTLAIGFAAGVAAPAATAQAIVSDHVRTFAVLPDGLRYPEGITANPANGDIYVATFDFLGGQNALLRYDLRGRLLARRDVAFPMLGLQYGPKDGKLYIANFGQSKIQRVNADLSGSIDDVAALPVIGAPLPRTVGNPDGSNDTIIFGSNGFPVPNAMAFDAAGNLFVSDSFQGAIFRIAAAHACAPCSAAPLVQHPLLATAGFPPFGANGLAFSTDETALFVANTGDDRVLKLDMATLQLAVFAESVNGADGLAMDAHGLLWVAANQADTLVALDPRGRVVAQVGSFEGLRRGRPEGLLFPASLVFVGREVFVTNLALPLTDAVGDEPEEDVTQWTVSRVLITPVR